MKAVGGVLVASFVGIAVLAIFLVREIGVGSAVGLVASGLLLLGGGLLLLTAAVRVSVGDGIDVRFHPIWHRSIPFDEVEQVRVEDAAWMRFGGIGLRWRPGATGLIFGNRPAAVIRLRSGHEYVVQCADPGTVVAAIQERLRAR
jgi:hypothetical protein